MWPQRHSTRIDYHLYCLHILPLDKRLMYPPGMTFFSLDDKPGVVEDNAHDSERSQSVYFRSVLDHVAHGIEKGVGYDEWKPSADAPVYSTAGLVATALPKSRNSHHLADYLQPLNRYFHRKYCHQY